MSVEGTPVTVDELRTASERCAVDPVYTNALVLLALAEVIDRVKVIERAIRCLERRG